MPDHEFKLLPSETIRITDLLCHLEQYHSRRQLAFTADYQMWTLFILAGLWRLSFV